MHIKPGPPDASTSFPQTMTIDYVKVYSKSGRQGQIKGVGDRCIDVLEARTENGTPVQLYDCNATPAQQWTISEDGTVRVFDKCLDVAGAGMENGTPVQISDCNNSDAQKWNLSAAGDIVNRNKCLDARQPANVNSARLQLWDCTGGTNQKWTFP